MFEALSFSDIMFGGDEVQVRYVQGNAQNETQMLTDEDIKEIKEKVDGKEEADHRHHYSGGILGDRQKNEPV